MAVWGGVNEKSAYHGWLRSDGTAEHLLILTRYTKRATLRSGCK